jgi:hypothetical protein
MSAYFCFECMPATTTDVKNFSCLNFSVISLRVFSVGFFFENKKSLEVVKMNKVIFCTDGNFIQSRIIFIIKIQKFKSPAFLYYQALIRKFGNNFQ